MRNRLDEIEKRYRELQELIADPQVMRDNRRYRDLLQENSRLSAIVDEFTRYRRLEREIASTREMIEGTHEHELREMAREELKALEQRYGESERQLKLLLVPRDPMGQKNTIMEIRAGPGGEEAALFCADLFRLYSRFAERQGWKVEILSAHPTEIGGFKEIIFSVQGQDVFESLQYESGVHRVQRVPVTEAGGRIHTSTVTVAVLPEVEPTEVDIRQEDLRIDVFRSGGPGGQSVNTTDSAVRVTHLPSGLVVICQDEKSQHKNKAKALRVLRARLFEMEERKRQEERARERRSQVGTGERSERIRTYNFPQNRVTDHRINLTVYHLDRVMMGDLDEFVDALKLSAHEERLKSEIG
jgi:peptide chain release factor 1